MRGSPTSYLNCVKLFENRQKHKGIFFFNKPSANDCFHCQPVEYLLDQSISCLVFSWSEIVEKCDQWFPKTTTMSSMSCVVKSTTYSVYCRRGGQKPEIIQSLIGLFFPFNYSTDWFTVVEE